MTQRRALHAAGEWLEVLSMAQEFFKVKSREQALKDIERFSPVGEEEITLLEARGRVLSRPLFSPENLPPFSRATMDGLAVRAQDTFGASQGLPSLLRVAGEVRMGQRPQVVLGPGEAVQISTGGMLPEGANAVVMVEYTQRVDEDMVEVYKPVAPNENVVREAEDVAAGEEVLPAGWHLRPQDVGLLAGLGLQALWVHRRPVVAIVSTGDEIVPTHERPGPGQVRDLNGVALSVLVEQEGGIPLRMGIVPDQKTRLERVCREAMERADCLLLSGGSSVGARDFALEALTSLGGAEILTHGLAVRPGKPTLLARVGSTPVVALPGHPVSALVIFHILVRPLLDRLCGRRCPRRSLRVRARLARNLPSAQGREDYVRVTLQEEGGEQWARPVLGSSGLIRTLVRADGLVRIDPLSEGLYRGEWVEVEPFP
ncbi:MAG: molybdopterin molybdotransferase MoeA [Thermodesulfobacteriota bacterium]